MEWLEHKDTSHSSSQLTLLQCPPTHTLPSIHQFIQQILMCQGLMHRINLQAGRERDSNQTATQMNTYLFTNHGKCHGRKEHDSVGLKTQDRGWPGRGAGVFKGPGAGVEEGNIRGLYATGGKRGRVVKGIINAAEKQSKIRREKYFLGKTHIS